MMNDEVFEYSLEDPDDTIVVFGNNSRPRSLNSYHSFSSGKKRRKSNAWAE